MTDLYTEHMTGTANGLMHERFEQLQDRNLRPEYVEHKVIGSESSDQAYLVSKVETLTVPFESADVSADTTTVWLCGCPSFHYHSSAGIEVDMNPADIEPCKHIDAKAPSTD